MGCIRFVYLFTRFGTFYNLLEILGRRTANNHKKNNSHMTCFLLIFSFHIVKERKEKVNVKVSGEQSNNQLTTLSTLLFLLYLELIIFKSYK